MVGGLVVSVAMFCLFSGEDMSCAINYFDSGIRVIVPKHLNEPLS